MRLVWTLAVAALLAVPATAGAQDDTEGAKDHPMLSRVAGYFIDDYTEQGFGVGEFTLGEEKVKKVEGRYWHIDYSLKEGARAAGPLQVTRNYLNVCTSKGGKKLYEEVETGWGTVTCTMVVRGTTVWVNVHARNGGDSYALTVVEEGGFKQEVEFTASQLEEELNAKGSVALHGILFDTGKATIKPESSAVLEQVGTLLKAQPALRLEIQGHTDNAGAKGANLKLSQDRAAAVKAYLVKTHGIDAARLTTTGLGDTKPVADNGTEDGRQQNRRVELVKK